MQKKSVLSLCIAVALSGNSYAETAPSEKNRPTKSCPTNISVLTEAQKAKLPAECLKQPSFLEEQWGWVAGGVAAVAAAVGIAVANDGGDDNGDSGYTPPTPPDDGGDTPTPPDDGGDTPTPPDDGGDTPVPPDDGGNGTATFTNGVVWDQASKTLTISGTAWTYADNGDGTYTLTDPVTGNTAQLKKYDVDPNTNTIKLYGVSTDGKTVWLFDKDGTLTTADASKAQSGDNQQIDGSGGSASGAGNAGQIIDGNNNTIDNKGDSTASDGGSGTVISGDDNTINNDGKIAAEGEGSTGTLINGNDATLNNTGDTTASAGGTGIKIDGDNADVTNSGATQAEGAGSTGTLINGNDATVNNTGTATVTDGGTGTQIEGNGATVNNEGNTTAQGSGSTGLAVNGDEATINQQGDLLVTQGATGVMVAGNLANITNSGNITVRDAGSTGVIISGDDASFTHTGSIDSTLSGAGVLIEGDDASVSLEGAIDVHSSKNSQGEQEGATGISITGNHSDVSLTGDMSVSQMLTGTESATGSVIGLKVTGDNNHVMLDGSVDVTQTHDTTDAGELTAAHGVEVSGTGNIVDITGGVNVTSYEQNASIGHDAVGITVSGKSTVNVSGASSADYTGIVGDYVSFARITNGGKLVLTENSVLDLTSSTINEAYYNTSAMVHASGTGSEIDNQGIINGNTGILMEADNGATVYNSGTVNVQFTDQNGYRSVVVQADYSGTAMNSGEINLTSTNLPYYATGNYTYPLAWVGNTGYALEAGSTGDNSLLNDTDGTINLHGAGLYGVGVVSGTGANAGTINVDSFIPVIDADGNITGESYYDMGTQSKAWMSAGMIVSGALSGGVVTNTGTINVNNEGTGMIAMSGGKAVNQGTINLTADAGVTKTADNQLIGMAAYDGGVVINDTTGVININADYGQAFYSEGNGIIINKGSINLDGSTMDPADPHMGSKPTDKTLLDSAYGSMSDTTLDDAEGFIMPAAVANYGKLTLTGGDLQVSGSLYNRAGATLNADLSMGSNTTFFNDGQFTGKANMASYSTSVVNTGTMTASADGDAVIDGSFQYFNQAGGTITNGSAQAATGGVNYLINNTRTTNNSGNGVNSGKIVATNGYGAINLANTGTGAANQIYQNTATGEISGSGLTDKVLIQLGKGYGFANSGTITLENSTNAVAIQTANTSYEQKVINAGTINLGSADASDTSSGLIAMKGSNAGNTTLNNTATGVINIYADNSYAFGGSYTKVINNGQVNLACGNSTCGIFAPGASNTNENTGAADLSIPAAATAPSQGSVPADPDAVQNISGYQVGTNANGTAGTLTASRMMLQDVSVDTGFTSGTAATTETFDNVFIGEDIQGVENIKSTSVVWTASGEKDSDGNVDVTMSKNAYTDVVNDSGVSSVAAALDAGYTNNELYNSLNLKTSAELDSALKQISGSKATGVSRDARILSNRFDMLADVAPVMNNGLAFNVVAKGDQRAELSNDTTYDMLALRQSLAFGGNQTLSMEYGIARLDGNGNAMSAGDNGVTGGYSQFFGLKHSLPLSEDGLSWDNALRYDVHNFDSNRAVRYGDVNKTANADTRQQYMEFRTEGSKAFKVQEALTVTPFAGLKMRHTMEDGYSEKGAGDFNLNMSSSSETAVDAVVGLKLSYAGEDGWAATASLEGGPNLSYAKSNRTASLAGARGQTFSVQDDQQGGGVNGQAMAGVKYSSGDAHFTADAYHWQEDGVKDKGFMVNYKHTF